MRDITTRVFGWVFISIGVFTIISAVVVATLRNTNFIQDEEIFRVAVIGLVCFVSGNIALCVDRVEKALHSFSNVKQ